MHTFVLQMESRRHFQFKVESGLRREKKKSFENERLKEDGDRRRQTGSAVKDDADAISSVNSRLFSSVFLPE